MDERTHARFLLGSGTRLCRHLLNNQSHMVVEYFTSTRLDTRPRICHAMEADNYVLASR